MSNSVCGYFFGYDGEWLTKEEFEKKVAEAKAEAERERQYWTEHQEEWAIYNG